MPNSSAVEKAGRCSLRAYLRRERAPLVERLDLAKRILAAVARRHEAGRPAGRLDPDTVFLTGVRSFRVDLEDAPQSGVRRRGTSDNADDWAVSDVRAVGALLAELLDDQDLPAGPARVVAAMSSETTYADARLAMNAFARSVP